MNAKDGQQLVLILGAMNLVMFAICLGMVWWSRKWKTRWAQVAGMVVFGLGTLLFGGCAIFLGGAFVMG